MKLSELEAEIVAAVSVRADASIPEIAKIVGARIHKCRHVLDKLISNGTISRRVVVNPGRIGFGCYGLYFSLSSRLQHKQEDILRTLISSPNISYIGELSGEFEWRVDILAKTAYEARSVIADLCAKYGPIIAARSMFCSLSISDFSLSSLTGKVKKASPICVDFCVEQVELNDQDHRILRALTSSPNAPQALLARKLGIPLTTLNFRIKKLQERAIIVGYHMLTEVEHLRGYNIGMYIHRVRLSQSDKATRSKLTQFIECDPAVHGLTWAFGDIDAEVCTASTLGSSEHDFEKRLKKALDEKILSLSTLRFTKHHKVNSYPF